MEDQKTELFGARVNEDGKYYIRKFAGVAKVGFFLTVLISIGYIYQFIQIMGTNFSAFVNADVPIWKKLQPLLFMLSTVLNVYGVLCYLRFSVQIKESSDDGNEEYFNRSFRLLYRNAMIFMLVLILNLVTTTVMVITTFQSKL